MKERIKKILYFLFVDVYSDKFFSHGFSFFMSLGFIPVYLKHINNNYVFTILTLSCISGFTTIILIEKFCEKFFKFIIEKIKVSALSYILAKRCGLSFFKRLKVLFFGWGSVLNVSFTDDAVIIQFKEIGVVMSHVKKAIV